MTEEPTMKCETWSIDAGHCPDPAAYRLTQTAAGVAALACAGHAARWMRTKKVRGQIVRVHPYMTIEELAR